LSIAAGKRPGYGPAPPMPRALKAYFELGLENLREVVTPPEKPADAPAEKPQQLHGVAIAGVGAAAIEQDEIWWRLLLAVGVVTLVLAALWLLRRWHARKQRLLLELAAWVFVGLGIFFRQNIDIPTLSWTFGRFDLGALSASLVISLAVFPGFMRRFMRKPRAESIALVTVPFGFGFFLDLAVLGTIWIVPKITGALAATVF